MHGMIRCARKERLKHNPTEYHGHPTKRRIPLTARSAAAKPRRVGQQEILEVLRAFAGDRDVHARLPDCSTDEQPRIAAFPLELLHEARIHEPAAVHARQLSSE